jgi:hypothetical protein
MTKSILLYLDRSETVQIIDSDSLPHTDDLSPIMLIAAAVINAGYAGVIVDEQRMANGRYFQALNTDIATPEGKILCELSKLDPAVLPTPEAVLDSIRKVYRHLGGVA